MIDKDKQLLVDIAELAECLLHEATYLSPSIAEVLEKTSEAIPRLLSLLEQSVQREKTTRDMLGGLFATLDSLKRYGGRVSVPIASWSSEARSEAREYWCLPTWHQSDVETILVEAAKELSKSDERREESQEALVRELAVMLIDRRNGYAIEFAPEADHEVIRYDYEELEEELEIVLHLHSLQLRRMPTLTVAERTQPDTHPPANLEQSK